MAGVDNLSDSLRSFYLDRRSSTDLIVAAAGFIKVLASADQNSIYGQAGWKSLAQPRAMKAGTVAPSLD